MDVELGLKITKTKDDIASISEYRLAKDKSGPIFQSRETNNVFILTAHLKGYKRNNINIKISEDGSKISISGERPIQNILMMGWLMHRKEVDVVGFNKVFKIPDGVKLDDIKAKYDEEDRILNISMPKLVKGICGARIEEVKEEESHRGGSKLEKREVEQTPSSVGETSQKGSKEPEVQPMEDRKSLIEEKEGEVSDKMLDDANRKIIKDTIQKEVENSKLGTKGGNRESFGENVGKEECEVRKISELEKNVLGDTSQKIGDTRQKEIENSKLRIEDGGVKGMREEVGKIEYEVVKTSETMKKVGVTIPQNKDTNQDGVFEYQEMEDNEGFVKEKKGMSENKFDEVNTNIIGEVIQKEIGKPNLEIEDKDGESMKGNIRKVGYKGAKTSEIKQNIGANVTQNIGDMSQGLSKEPIVEQRDEAKRTIGKMERQDSKEMLVKANVCTEEETLRDSKQKQFREPKFEVSDRLKEGSMELTEIIKASKLDQNENDQILSNIGGISQEKYKKSTIQKKKKTGSIEENVDGGKSERILVEASKDNQKLMSGDCIQMDMKKPKIETKDVDQECVGEKFGKKEFDSMTTIKEGFPELLPKATIEESKGLSASKMQETKDIKNTMTKRKPKNNENFVDKDDWEESKRMDKEAKNDITIKERQESEYVKEAMTKKERKQIQYFVDDGEREVRKKMHVEAMKDFKKETIEENEDFKESMIESEGEGSKRIHIKAKNDFAKNTMQETEDVTKVMVKRKYKEIENLENKGEVEELKKMHMEAKDTEKETMQESKEVKEAIVKNKGKEIEHFVKKGEDEELMSKQMEAKNELKKVIMQENEQVKEALVKRKGKENKYLLDKGEGEESKRMHIEAKKNLSKEMKQKSENVKESMVKREDKEIEYFVDTNKGGESKTMHMEEKNYLTKETMKEIEDVKEAMVKKEDKEINYLMEKGEGEEPNMMHIEAKKDFKIKPMQEFKKVHVEANKDLVEEKMQENEDVKEVMVKRKGKETKYFVDTNKGGEPKMMHIGEKKDITKKAMEESEDVKEAMVKKDDKEIDYFLEKSEGREPNMMHIEAKKDLKIKLMQESHAKNAMIERKDKETNCLLDEDKGENSKRMHMKTKKDLTIEKMRETKDVKEIKVKRKDREIKDFVEKNECEELRKMLMEENKQLTKDTIQESGDVKEAMVKKTGEEIEYFLDKDKGKESNEMLEVKKDLTTKSMQESEGVKETMVKLKGVEIEYSLDEDGEEPKRIHKKEKDLTIEKMQENEDVKEVIVKRKNEVTENLLDKDEDERHKRILKNTKEELIKEELQKREDFKGAVVKQKGKEIEYFMEKGEGEESKGMHMETNKDLEKVMMQESEHGKEVMIKRKNKVTEYFVDMSKDEDPKRMHMEANRDLTKDTMQENEDVKEAILKSEGKKIEYFLNDDGEVEEPNRMKMKVKKDLTTETIDKNDVKEVMVKRKEKDIDYFLDEDKGEEYKMVDRKANKDSITETMQEIEDINEVMVKKRNKEIENFAYNGDDKEYRMSIEAMNLTNETMQESKDVKETMVKKKDNEIDYFVDKGEGEEIKRTHRKVKKDIRKDSMQKEIEKIKIGIKDNDQENALKKIDEEKFEAPIKVLPKLVIGQDESSGLKVADMEEQRWITKEDMVKTERLKENMLGEKSKNIEEVDNVIEKNIATRILQEETKESSIERKFKDGPYIPENMVKLVFEVLGTFQAKLPKQVMEAIAQNKNDANEYVIVKLKGEGSIKMHVEPNETFDEEASMDKMGKEIRKPKLRSSDQISGKENVNVGVFDESKIEGPKDKIVNKDQHEQRGVANRIGKVDNIEKYMLQKENVTNVSPIAQKMETKKDLKATLEREKYMIAQKVKDEKFGIHEKNIRDDVEKFDKEGYQIKVADWMLKGEYVEEVVPEKERDKQNVAKSEEVKETFRQPLKKDMAKTTQATEDKSKMKEITQEFEKPSGFKQVVERMHESHKEKHQKDPKEVIPKIEVKAPTITTKKEVQKSKKDEMSHVPKVIQRKEREKDVHAPEATISKKEELAQATTMHSITKGDIDKPQVTQLLSSSREMWSKEPRKLHKHGMKEYDLKDESLVQMQGGRESIHSIKGSATSEAIANGVVEPSKFFSSFSTQPFKDEEKDKINTSRDQDSQDVENDSKIDGQESTKSKTNQEVEKKETIQPELPEDQQFIHKDQEEERHGTHEIEEENAFEKGDGVNQEESQALMEQKECEEEATRGKKNNQKRSKKLFVSMIIAGSTLLGSGIFLFIRHRRARKG
uniref:SHSP domain-containing protein n=2 Tax=Cajanus cajan TaxID=3821 RepID=A0A151T2X2_CAJCA|nr:hypothetical protein KK1_015902 [Cajanus cajan]